MPIDIVGPKSITLPASLGGDDQVFGLTLVAATRGLYVEDLAGDRVCVKGITDEALVSLDVVRLLLSKGCEVLGYPVFFELTAEQLNQEVPENFPHRTQSIIDPQNIGTEPAVTVHTWESWGDSVIEVDGRYFKSNQDRAALGVPLPASLWATNGNLSLVSVQEFKALHTVDPWPTP